MPKFKISTSKIMLEHWIVEAENEEEAKDNLYVKGKKIKESVFDVQIDRVVKLKGL